MIISVGEINSNKNHRVIIEALSHIEDKKVKYIICGKGNLEEKQLKRVKELNLEDRVKFLGFQSDVKSYLLMSDLFAFPSKREGLGLAAIEAMACGLPILTSNIHGINDYSINGVTGYKCNTTVVSEYEDAIKILKEDEAGWMKMNRNNSVVSSNYKLECVNEIMHNVYSNI